MISAGICRVAISGIAVAMLAGCTSIAVVDDHLEAGGVQTTEFSADVSEVTLSARFNDDLPADERFMVEWLFPDDRVYLRKPVYRSAGGDDLLETSMPVRGKASARHPGIWHVRLWHDGGTLVNRSFSIYAPGQPMTTGTGGFTGLAVCAPGRWHDAAINGRRVGAVASGIPGSWIGGDVLETAGATYSGMILLTGCAPG